MFSTHCHNDLGLAVANSLAGVAAGARQVECTDQRHRRAGGQCRARRDRHGAEGARRHSAVRLGHRQRRRSRARRSWCRTSQAFRSSTTRPSWARTRSRTKSGIHQDGMLKNTQTYEIMTPESVGVSKTSLVLGKLSGRHAFKDKLEAMGYELGANALEDAFRRFKDLADKKKHMFDEDIVGAGRRRDRARPRPHSVRQALRVVAGTFGPQSAELELSVDGQTRLGVARGDGPVDAIFNAIKTLFPHDGDSLQLFQVHAVTEGTDAQAGVTVRLERRRQERHRARRGHRHDGGGGKAYVHALNKLLVKRQKTAPEALTAARCV